MQSQPSHMWKAGETDYRRSSGYRFVIVGLMASLVFSAGLNMFPIGPIVPVIIGDYGINNSTAGFLTSIIFLVHVVFAIPVNLLVGRIGLKMLIGFGAVTSSVPVLSFLAVDSYPLLLTIRAIYGVGFILLFPTSGPLFMQWFRPKELPFVNGSLMLSASLGLAVSAFLVAPLSEAIGWEIALSVFGGVSLGSAVVWLLLGKAQRIPADSEPRPLIRRVWEVLHDRSTLLVAAADAGPLALLTVSLGWLPTLYHEVHNMPLEKGGVLMGLLSLAGFISLVLASILTTRISKRRPFLIIPGIVVGFAGLACILLPDSVVLYIAVVVLGFACWFYLPALITIPMELYPNNPRRVSLIFASLMSIGGMASFVSPPFVGVIGDLTGSLVPGLGVFAIFAWSLAIAGILLPETGTTRIEPGESPGDDSVSMKV
ncbi:MFS transporter [SAR202 cluster bacterium AC-647-N09_OGT_505m]|nr:MFS transporter [SAR202 cluster bacterium AC-647-N09_OGT_505m]